MSGAALPTQSSATNEGPGLGRKEQAEKIETQSGDKKVKSLTSLFKKIGKRGGGGREEIDRNEDTKFAPTSALASSPIVTKSAAPVSSGTRSPSLPMTPSSIDREGTGSPRSPLSVSASPSRGLRTSSPKLLSPASSLIFERNVQESHVPDDLSHAIPSHIQTEDRIPPVLEASSLAITDNHINPDDVEILTHSAHTRAADSVPIGTPHGDFQSPTSSGVLPPQLSHEAMVDVDETAPSYGAIDTTDPRRLSFISFADVVQAEHAENSTRESIHMPRSPTTRNRSPSPMRSPVSTSSLGFFSAAGPSPPTSGGSSAKGIPIRGSTNMLGGAAAGQQSPPVSSPTLSATGGSGDLVTETMSMAMKMVGTTDENQGLSK